MKKQTIWLDCDPGHDDALAIVLAAYDPRLELGLVSTVWGNQPLKSTTENALQVLEVSGMAMWTRGSGWIWSEGEAGDNHGGGDACCSPPWPNDWTSGQARVRPGPATPPQNRMSLYNS